MTTVGFASPVNGRCDRSSQRARRRCRSSMGHSLTDHIANATIACRIDAWLRQPAPGKIEKKRPKAPIGPERPISTGADLEAR